MREKELSWSDNVLGVRKDSNPSIRDSCAEFDQLKPMRPIRRTDGHLLGVVDYEEINREIHRILIYECRCDERLRPQSEGSTRLGYTGVPRGTGTPKDRDELIDGKFESCDGRVCDLGIVVFTIFYFIMNQENES